MGVINHNAVIATTESHKNIDDLKDWITYLGNIEESMLFVFIDCVSNNICTVILAPDGEDEGTKYSDKGDDLRQKFIKYLGSEKYNDGSDIWSWIEVGYGEFGQKILRGNNKNRYGSSKYQSNKLFKK